jgi:hypothetical protein
MAPDHAEKDVLLAEYNQVVTQFRALMDIRFKLLAYLPLGTVAAVLVSKDGQLASEPAVAVFAFIATLCIATYNKRNDQHYDELVGRAAELERELGLNHGSFSQRPASWLRYGRVKVEHRWPIGLLYAASAALWAFIAVKSLLALSGEEIIVKNALESLAPVIVILCWWLLREMENARDKKIGAAIRELQKSLVAEGAPAISSEEEKIAKEIAKYEPLLGIDLKEAKRRVHYHWDAYASKHDLQAGSDLLSAVIDLPARWIADVWTGRR